MYELAARLMAASDGDVLLRWRTTGKGRLKQSFDGHNQEKNPAPYEERRRVQIVGRFKGTREYLRQGLSRFLAETDVTVNPGCVTISFGPVVIIDDAVLAGRPVPGTGTFIVKAHRAARSRSPPLAPGVVPTPSRRAVEPSRLAWPW